MASIWYAIINYLLQDHFHSCFTMERQVFTVTGNYLSVALESFLNRGIIRALMLHQSFRSNILNVFSRGYVKLIIPSQLAYWLQVAQVLDGLLNGRSTFFSSQCDSARLLHEETFETTLHFLEMGNELAGV
jgi:hypothetical protein